VNRKHAYLGEVLHDVRTHVRRYVVIGDIELDAIALWTAHTYVYAAAQATPYLHPYSPEPGSGKTTLLDVLDQIAWNAVQGDNLSEAVLFRMIHAVTKAKGGVTLLFDEVDTIFRKKNSDSADAIRGVLNSGYRKGKVAWRCVPPSHEAKPFDVYCPKATAGLHGLPGTLAHRSIPIAMQPPLPTDTYEEFDPEEANESADAIARNLEMWMKEADSILRDPRLKPARLADLDARGNEIWRILLRIGDHAGGDWPDRARTAAVRLSGRQNHHHDTSAAVRLLGHVRDVFTEERMTCAAIASILNEDEQMPYGGWNDGKGISTRELGKKLGPYGILAKPIRIDGSRAGNGYVRDQFEDAWVRYLPDPDPQNRYTGTTRITEPKTAGTNPVQEPRVPVFENGANPHQQRHVPVVRVLRPLVGDGATNCEPSMSVTGRWWECPCGAVVSLREPKCPFCGHAYREEYARNEAGETLAGAETRG
jgi:Protein of unknown function (DUF3631)